MKYLEKMFEKYILQQLEIYVGFEVDIVEWVERNSSHE